MSRIFFLLAEQIQFDTKTITFSSDTLRHLIALRKEVGDIITCILNNNQKDAKITVYSVSLDKNSKGFFGHILTSDEEEILYKNRIHIIQCIPKLDKLEYITQKAGELGVYEIIPVISHYTQNHKAFIESKQLRLAKIAEEASIQSGRKDIIRITAPTPLRKFLSANETLFTSETTLCFLLNEYEKEIHLSHYADLIPPSKDVYLLIGSEGGFDAEELALAEDRYGFHSLSLGSQILRTETAPIVMTSILQYLLGNI